MRALLAALAAFALVFGTSEATGAEQPAAKRLVQRAAAVQAQPSTRDVGRKADARRQFSATQDFRAQDLIPDICRGCSS